MTTRPRSEICTRGGRRGDRLPAVLAGLLLLGAALLPGLQSARPAQAAEVPQVIGGETPRDGVRDLTLTEMWRRGGEDDEELLVGMVASVLTDREGNVYALDSQLSEVHVFDLSGRLLRTLGRKGQGPGEFENAARITFLPGSDAIGVTQMFPGKLVGLKLDGTPAGDIKIGGDPASGGFASVIGAHLGGDNLVVTGVEITFNQTDQSMNRRHFVRSYARDGAQRCEYHTHTVHWSFAGAITLSETENDYVWWRTAVDREGRVLVGVPREEYRINVYGAGGALERVFGRAYQSLPRTPDMLARFERMIEAQSRQMPPGTRTEVAKNEQDIWGINCLPDGTTWVTTSRGMFTPPAGVFTVWDVFDRDGAFVQQVQARVPGKPGQDFLLVTEHGYAVMVTGFWSAVMSAMGAGSDDDDAEAMQIICYRMEI